ncbi:hypothetical protein [Demequina litorisediminis]|uniref:hypothetical protein n=1 Tax=Demequina litorisediminis TaxID=1849022 RepID=UPI0024E11A97|nr:hypothetical protein [Demequina litorisediminis]
MLSLAAAGIRVGRCLGGFADLDDGAAVAFLGLQLAVQHAGDGRLAQRRALLVERVGHVVRWWRLRHVVFLGRCRRRGGPREHAPPRSAAVVAASMVLRIQSSVREGRRGRGGGRDVMLERPVRPSRYVTPAVPTVVPGPQVASSRPEDQG